MMDIRCPVCGDSAHDIVYCVNSSQSAQHFVLLEEDRERHIALKKEIERLWGGGICWFMRCQGCSFMFSEPFVGGGGDFYSLAFQRKCYPQEKWEYRLAKRYLMQEGIDLRRAKVFEVGAGDGAFLKIVCPELFDENNVLCTEYSEYGREMIRLLGIKSFDVDFLEYEFNNKIQYFFAFQVFEHLDSLDARFNKISSVMAENGMLFLSFPNEKRIEFNIHNNSLLEMPPNHISVWNKIAVGRLLDKYGFELLVYYDEPYSLVQSFNQYARYLLLRSSQNSGSVTNKIVKNRVKYSTFTYAILCAAAVIGLSIINIAGYARLLSTRSGNSSLAILKKIV